MPPRRPAWLLALATLALLGSPALAPPRAAAARADARGFTRATLAFDLARGRAIGRAERRGDARRRQATACMATLQDAPSALRPDLFALYVTWVGQGYFTEDEPIFARWVRDLGRIRTQDVVLRRARAALRRDLRRARARYAQARRFCSPVEAWAAGGWSAEARPPALARLQALDAARDPAPERRALQRDGPKRLKSLGGSGGALAGDVLREAVDEPDEQVINGDDPVVAVLAPGP